MILISEKAMSDKKIITTAIAYANGAPHIGHAFEFVMSDTIARYAKSQGDDVFFVTGMDEHGQKIQEKAKEKNVPVLEFVEEYANLYQELDKDLAVDYDFFVRTSDKEKHYKGAQALWNKIVASGDLEKRTYTALYCVGCEEFKTEKDLNEQGECPAHLKKPEVVEEENYFFKLSKYGETLKEKIVTGEMQIIPESRKNEILALLERGLEDISFSRPISKVAWGIPVPGDDTQVMYVWCDALSNYITALGYGTDAFDVERWNNSTHIVGKDILRFHTAIWPAMLLSAGLPVPKKILVHGHITSGGQKMSKSLGNVIDPREVIELFRSPAGELAGEALRYILLYKIPSFDDGDLTLDTIKETYTAHLANGIGNLTSRIMKMAITNSVVLQGDGCIELENYFKDSNVNTALHILAHKVTQIDKNIATSEPFKLIKSEPQKAKEIIGQLVRDLYACAKALEIFMPQTSAKILECIRENKMPEKPLFGRLV
jgi:methionyl-tRNA synthetase